jgi:hypothetical protein
MTTNISLGKVKSLYDTINPSTQLKDAAKGKVILITGAGRGLYPPHYLGISTTKRQQVLVRRPRKLLPKLPLQASFYARWKMLSSKRPSS